MRIEVYVFPDDHDEGKKDVDEFNMFEVDLFNVEEFVLIDAAKILKFLLQLWPGYPAIWLRTKHLLDNGNDILTKVWQ